jgi:Ran GTPase-activating protein 1
LEPLQGRDIEYVDLSDNAFGPSGVPGFDFFIKSTPSIKVLKMINCGLGPAGGTLLSECLIEGKLKLREFYAGRNRMEDTGYKAIASALKEMGTLVKIEMPQNFVKKDGMITMIDALKQNESLEYLHIHDNWLKEEAIKEFSELIRSLGSLKSINISDCDIGGLGVKKIARAIGNSKSRDVIKEFYCNYNDVERTQTAQFIFNVFRICKNLKKVSFIGNTIKAKLKKQYIDEFEKQDKVLVMMDEEEELDEDELEEELSDEEEEEEDSEKETDETKALEKLFQDLSLE